MAMASWDLLTSLSLLLVLLAGAATGSAAPSSLTSPPLMLPLVLTAGPNSSVRPRETVALLHRRLSAGYPGAASAQMGLHDDLLTTGYPHAPHPSSLSSSRVYVSCRRVRVCLIRVSASYFLFLYVGTTPLESTSGPRPKNSPSSSTPGAPSPTSLAPTACTAGTIRQASIFFTDPRFEPDLSGTYEPVKCNNECACDEKNKQCVYDRQYAEMSTSSGLLGEDVISFGKESALKPQRAVFGCETNETGDLFSQHADGIMGLGRGHLSIMDQLVHKGVVSNSFSLCYGGMDVGGGAMVLGGISPPADMVYSRSDPNRSPYYNVDLKELHVAGKPLRIQPMVFDRRHGTILDSGTTYAYLPEQAYVPFIDAIKRNLHSLKQINGPDPNYKDICFSGAGSDALQLSKAFPKVDMVFGNGQKLTLSPENYLFRHSKVQGAYCLGVFQNGKDGTTLLGGIVVRNTLVTYDRQNERIGFWKTNCSELWSELHIATSPPMVSPASPNKNSTVEVPLDLPPSGSHLLPGHIQVGLITFDLSLNVTYSKLAPHIKELVELIAHDLEVDTHQVKVKSYI
ncbi:aspartic proteinase CDR1-like [Iris pallida]|uniref:Aspartic proteinase CDR1-like n=1 Tax=Iris pallida TaxID=29817 RepID=A0AAX6EMD7_IRIPA|nr:aspartic proteinase CDR1-like [Iris pallida]